MNMKDRVKPSVDRKFSIALPSIKSGIEKNGFAIWKDTEFANLIEAARIEYLSVFKSLTLHPQTEPFLISALLSPYVLVRKMDRLSALLAQKALSKEA
jgi:hypothetical protein